MVRWDKVDLFYREFLSFLLVTKVDTDARGVDFTIVREFKERLECTWNEVFLAISRILVEGGVYFTCVGERLTDMKLMFKKQ